MHENNLEGLLKHGLVDPTPRVCDSAGLGWGSGKINAILALEADFENFCFKKDDIKIIQQSL